MVDPRLDQSFETLLETMGLPQPRDVRWRLLCLLQELLHWNRRHNLTAIKDPLAALELHFADSLSLLPLLPAKARLLDIGSGAGFPGMALKVCRPDLDLISVDSVGKKISFQRHLVRYFGLHGVDLRHCRAEQLADDSQISGQCQVATSRAFGQIPLFARLAQPCLAPGGILIAMKGPEGSSEAEAAEIELERLGFLWQQQLDYQLPQSGHRRSLLVWSYQRTGKEG